MILKEIEDRPLPTNKAWQKINNNIAIIKSSLTYKITDKLINSMKKYTKIYLKTPDADMYNIIKTYNDGIGIIYLIKNTKTGDTITGTTSNSLLSLIKYNIHKLILGGDNIFENIEYTHLTDLEVRLLEFVKFKTIHDLLDRKEEYSSDQQPITNNPTTDFFKRRMVVFNEVFKPFSDKFKPLTGLIYSIKNTKTNRETIFGIDKNTDYKYIFSERTMDDKLKLLEIYKARSIFDFMLRIDYLRLTHNTLESFNFPESEKLFKHSFPSRSKAQVQKNFFIRIQKLLMLKNLGDRSYKNIYGFIYMIENKTNNMKYINYAINKPLKTVITELYDKALKDNIKYNKILKALMEFNYDQFNFKILKVKTINDMSTDLKGDTQKYIKKFNTINKGYNIDHNDLRSKIQLSQRYKNGG
jgi:hypothetical protein